VTAAKSNAGVKGKPAPKKPQPVTGSSKSKVTSKPVTTKAVAPKLPASKPVAAKTATPVKSTTPAKSTAPVKSASPAPTPKAKPQVVGSKASDVARKPTISTTHAGKEKSLPKPKVTGTPFKPTETKVKPYEKMLDKKEHKPTPAIATEEPQKTRYSDKELEEFDQLIDQKLIVAREQLEFYLKQLEDMAENPDNKIKGLDDGLSTLESERVSSLASRQQKLIQHLENAKIRIKNKVYGICRETGKLISKERLRAVPHATLSIEAKQAQN
jgi:RNA polymerase-binding transcription factor DksA